MLSDKQWEVMCFGATDYDALICDGAVRSGKTSVMSVAYIDWAMEHFDRCNFIIASVSVETARRNVVNPILATRYLTDRYGLSWSGKSNCLTVTGNGHVNLFYTFGGKDEKSYTIVQGLTAAGCFLDEVALMPRSFVEQCMARCSVDGSKFWFNCNPGTPQHWFRREWIQKAREKNAYHIHFLLEDNPSLSEKMVRRYESMYVGVFKRRYIDGEWVAAEGVIYPNWEQALEPKWAPTDEDRMRGYAISVDYGTQNPFHALKWERDSKGTWHIVEEYRHSGRESMEQRTDADYVADLVRLCHDAPEGDVEVIVDPSAASFIAALKRAVPFRAEGNRLDSKLRPRKAKNDVLDGIRDATVCLQEGRIRIADDLDHLKDEFEAYVWDDKAEDKPVKEYDHGMDAMRYFVETKRLVRPHEEYTSPFARYPHGQQGGPEGTDLPRPGGGLRRDRLRSRGDQAAHVDEGLQDGASCG